jgi:GDPmannose 4,6-dehydratase
VRIAAGKQDKLYLGKIDLQRDWGWAEDYVEAMYLMLQQEVSDDYVIATGESYQLAEFIEVAFRLVGLDWREYVGQ